jgi:hypothetical protein
MRLKDFTPPDTAAARAALELATTYHTQALLSHVIRSWLWAQGFAALEGRTDIDHDISGARPNSCATCWPRLPAEVHYRVGAFSLKARLAFERSLAMARPSPRSLTWTCQVGQPSRLQCRAGRSHSSSRITATRDSGTRWLSLPNVPAEGVRRPARGGRTGRHGGRLPAGSSRLNLAAYDQWRR